MKEMDAEICSEIEGEVSEMAKQSDAYAGMEENGKFSGCEAFRAKAMALFAERQMKKMQEEKRKKESAFAWNFAQGAGTAGDSIEECCAQSTNKRSVKKDGIYCKHGVRNQGFEP